MNGGQHRDKIMNNYSRIMKIISVCVSFLAVAMGIGSLVGGGAAELRITLTVLFSLWGVSKIMGYFSKDTYGLAFQYGLVEGVFAETVAALIMFKVGGNDIKAEAIWIGVYFIVEGLMHMQSAMDAKRFGLDKWLLTLVSAAALVAMGILSAMLTGIEGAPLTIMAGGCLLLGGLVNLWVTVYTVKIRRHRGRFAYWFSDHKEDRVDIVGELDEGNGD